MQNSYLIQRLKKPYYVKEIKTPLQALAKYGLAATGLSEKAHELLSQICIFDYMGSSEYEWGAIPTALRAMVNNQANLMTAVDAVDFTYKPFGETKAITGNANVYIIGNRTDIITIIERINEMTLGKENCKERTKFSGSLANDKYYADILGWFDLDNGFMFFKDKNMFNDFKTLFGLWLRKDKNEKHSIYRKHNCN